MLINASDTAFRHTLVSLNGSFGCRTRIQRGGAVGFAEAPRKGWHFSYPVALARMLKTLRPDLVLTYNWGAADGVLAARLCGIRRVIHQEDGFGSDEAYKQKLRRRLARQVILRGATRIVCPSQTLVRIATRLWGLPRRKIQFIPNGVDGMRFSPGTAATIASIRRRFGCSPMESIVGTVGGLRREKNQERLIRAFSTIMARHHARLLIVGDGPLREDLLCLAQELGIGDRIIFTGVISDPVDSYQAMDVFALSSDTEQMPIVILEAMSVGLPIVSTDVGDIREMVSPVNRRYIVPVHNEEAYAQALSNLLEDAGTRAKLGHANREKCLEDYDLKGMIQSYLKLYREVLETRQR